MKSFLFFKHVIFLSHMVILGSKIDYTNKKIAKIFRASLSIRNQHPIPVLTCRYIPRYTFSWLVKPMWWVISTGTFVSSLNFTWILIFRVCELINESFVLFLTEFLHRAVDLTLVPSVALAKELEAARVTAGK